MLSSVYIHIPFCTNICNYCDFSKMYYKKQLVNGYLDELEKEIKNNYKGEIIKTIYIGGGSPSSLSLFELKKMFKIVDIFKLDKNYEFTIEVNSEDLNTNKMKLFKKNGVNRVSIGVESFDDNINKILNRHHTKRRVINTINNFIKIGINNINIDMIYGLKEQTLSSLKKELDTISKLNIKHISYYSLILEENTKLFIDKYEVAQIEEELKQYKYIKKRLGELGFIHYEISNYSKSGYYSKHNLVYWNNEKYYGFGLSSHGYIDNIRYENTRNINNYLKGNHILNSNILDKKEDMDNEVMLGLRKIKGIDKNKFLIKYNKNIYDVYKLDYLIKDKVLIDKNNRIYIPLKYLYISNEIIGRVLYGK